MVTLSIPGTIHLFILQAWLRAKTLTLLFHTHAQALNRVLWLLLNCLSSVCSIPSGICADVAVSKHEHWSALAPLPFEVVISAGQKAKEESDGG
jgi:hypothetical protein